MANKTIFICDGCDLEVVGPDGLLPPYWQTSSMRLDRTQREPGAPLAPLIIDSDLCSNCSEVQLDRVDPNKWARSSNARERTLLKVRAND